MTYREVLRSQLARLNEDLARLRDKLDGLQEYEQDLMQRKAQVERQLADDPAPDA